MKIELEKWPRWHGADDAHCIWELTVNGYLIGSYYGGKEKSYENKEKWAEKMIKKRVPVIERNIARLENELLQWKTELKALTEI